MQFEPHAFQQTTPMTVMIVDDDPVTGSVIERYLADIDNTTISHLGGGQEAIDSFSRQLPDLIILDYRMPEVDGFAVLKALSEQSDARDLPVLMITAAEEEEVMVRAMEAGASDFLHKPIKPAELVARVRNLLKLRRRSVELLAANARLREMATTDELTGLANRRHFFATANAEIDRARRFQRPISVLMIDVDHFKQVNDTHGHAAGDAVLRQLARILESSARRVDIVGRLGGEEFAVTSLETRDEDAMHLAERVRKAVEEEPIRIDETGTRISITVSIGVSGLKPGEATVDGMLNRADEALYRAKEGGRNRACR